METGELSAPHAHMASGKMKPFGASASVHIAALVAIVFCCIPRSMADPDIWWHLRNAQTLLCTHRFIGVDSYSFTARGAAWMNHEWLSELPFYFGWTVGGMRGVYGVSVAVIEALMLGIFLLAYRRSRTLTGALLVSIVAALLSTVTYGPRTVLFGWLCLVVELLLLDASESRGRLLWALPPLFALWVNTHGSWLIGLVVMSAYIALNAWRVRRGDIACEGMSRPRLRALLRASALSVVALFLNPYGWRLIAYPFNLAFRQRLNVANVQEWRSLDLHSPRGYILLGTLAFAVLSQLVRRRGWRPYELVFLFLGTYAALTYTRFLVLFAILAGPLLAASFSRASNSLDADRPPRPLLQAACIFFLACVMIGRYREPGASVVTAETGYPASALPFLAALHPHGRIFNEYLWGGYMIWYLREIPVFIDSRVDIFEYNGTFKDYLDIVRVKDSLALLDRYKIQYVFFERDTPLVYLLEHTGGWKIDYEQGNVILLERSRDSGNYVPNRP